MGYLCFLRRSLNQLVLDVRSKGGRLLCLYVFTRTDETPLKMTVIDTNIIIVLIVIVIISVAPVLPAITRAAVGIPV